MRRIASIIAIVSFMSILVGSLAFAQGGGMRRGGGQGSEGDPRRLYDTKTVETIAGEVVSVEETQPSAKFPPGIHLKVKTDKEEIVVHLGPATFLDESGMKVKAKDKLQITGSRITLRGEPVILAAEVKRGDQVLKLRDDAGRPLWRAGRRR